MSSFIQIYQETRKYEKKPAKVQPVVLTDLQMNTQLDLAQLSVFCVYIYSHHVLICLSDSVCLSVCLSTHFYHLSYLILHGLALHKYFFPQFLCFQFAFYNIIAIKNYSPDCVTIAFHMCYIDFEIFCISIFLCFITLRIGVQSSPFISIHVPKMHPLIINLD